MLALTLPTVPAVQLWLQDEDPWIELQSEDLGHPSCVGAKGKKHQETGKISHFFS